MPFKPMKRKAYERLIRKQGWRLVKGSVDWKLVDEQGNVRIPNIIITHPGNEVVAISVKKTLEVLPQ
jgi:hypothetical protein